MLPQQFRYQALQACHNNVRHLGIERTTHLLKDAERYQKTLPAKAAMNPFEDTHPWELIHIDFLTIKAPINSKSSKDVNILIITDHLQGMPRP